MPRYPHTYPPPLTVCPACKAARYDEANCPMCLGRSSGLIGYYPCAFRINEIECRLWWAGGIWWFGHDLLTEREWFALPREAGVNYGFACCCVIQEVVRLTSD